MRYRELCVYVKKMLYAVDAIFPHEKNKTTIFQVTSFLYFHFLPTNLQTRTHKSRKLK